MDYKIFAKENYNPTTLTNTEVRDPLVGLKEFLVGKSADQFKQHLRDLLFAVFEKHGWRQYGAPVNLYRKAKEVAKLIDFVWLITICEVGAQHKSVDPKEYYLSEQYRRRSFGKRFIKTPAKNKTGVVPSGDMAGAIFNERHGLLLKNDIEETWLKVALNSSYMCNLTIDFYCIETSMDVHDYWYMMAIIDTAFELANRPAPRLDTQRLNYYQLFASDVDHPDCLFEEDIELLFEGFGSVFWHIDEVKFPSAIRKWYALIAKTDHWKSHNDPGNVMFIKDTVQWMVEMAWLWSRVGYPKLGNCGVDKRYVEDLSAAEVADPTAYVEYFFDRHRLHEWKRMLDIWLVQSLSDEHFDQQTEVREQDREDIIKLIQVLRLMERLADGMLPPAVIKNN